jgi:MFS family permease
MSRSHYRRELVAWLFLPAMLGAIEGGVIGVLAKNAFEHDVGPRALNLAVAILAGAPAFSNITSFLWAALCHGRHKVRFLAGLQVLTAAFVCLIAFAPRSPAGLVLLTAAVVGARMCWSGVVTIRSTVWRVNYPRSDRATLAGNLATVQALVLTIVGLAVGAATQLDEDAFRVIYPAAAIAGLVGSWFYSGLRVRGHRALLRAERDAAGNAMTLVHPASLWRVLTHDPAFGKYMLCMFIFGMGNLMVTTPLVIILRDRFEVREFLGILIASSIPAFLMPFSIPWWSRLLNRVHIVQFRAVHSWAFVASIALFLLGAVTVQPWLMVLGAVAKGIAIGGGVLGWNLGHHDFAPRHLAGRYMGVHVTLTGLRGIIAPVLAVILYEMLEGRAAGAGAWVFACCLGLSLTGAAGFHLLARAARRAAVHGASGTAAPLDRPMVAPGVRPEPARSPDRPA